MYCLFIEQLIVNKIVQAFKKLKKRRKTFGNFILFSFLV